MVDYESSLKRSTIIGRNIEALDVMKVDLNKKKPTYKVDIINMINDCFVIYDGDV